MKKRIKNAHSIRIKAAVFFASLLFCLVLAEIGLRVGGYALTASRRREFVPGIGPLQGRILADDYFERYRSGKTDRLILTLGDSLTNSGNVKSHHSYPYFLYKLFEDAGEKAAVYNMGYCEDSTFGVALKIKNYLKTHGADQKPSDIVVLVGAADLFNLPLIRTRSLKDDTFWRDVLPRGWLYSLRLYKVYRHIRVNLDVRRNIKDLDEDLKTSEEKLGVILDVYDRHKKNAPPGAEPGLSAELTARLDKVFGEDYQQADLDFEEIGDFIELTTDYASRVYTTKHRYDELFALMLDIAEHFPRNFWIDYINTANYSMVQAYQVQSKFTAEEVLETLRKSEARHPGLSENVHFRHFVKILSDRDEMDAFVNAKRVDTWSEIAGLAKERGIRLYLQNYPVAYKSANEMIRRVAKEHGLPLVDNRAYFKDLIAREGRAKYLEDDDHLTPLGYEMLAKNVFSTIREAGVR